MAGLLTVRSLVMSTVPLVPRQGLSACRSITNTRVLDASSHALAVVRVTGVFTVRSLVISLATSVTTVGISACRSIAKYGFWVTVRTLWR